MMTKRHFEALAAALLKSRPDNHLKRLHQWRDDVLAIADVCHYSNPRFNLSAFLTAAGYQDDKQGLYPFA